MMIPLAQAVGRAIRCPDPGCGAAATVEPQRGRPAAMGGMPGPPGTAAATAGPVVVGRVQWPIVHCPKTGGRSFPGDTMVEVLDG